MGNRSGDLAVAGMMRHPEDEQREWTRLPSPKAHYAEVLRRLYGYARLP